MIIQKLNYIRVNPKSKSVLLHVVISLFHSFLSWSGKVTQEVTQKVTQEVTQPTPLRFLRNGKKNVGQLCN